MRLAAVVLALVGCGGAAAPAPIVPAPPEPAPSLQELADETGDPQLQARRFERLTQARDPAARAAGATLVENPGFAALPSAARLLYAYGALLSEARRVDDARAQWRRVVRDFPRSALVSEAQVALGDAAFDDGDLVAAEAAYTAALARPGRAAIYARYKRGWVFFNLARFDDALAAFTTVARDGDARMRKTALPDVVRAYAEAGEPSEARNFFAHLDRGRAAPLLLALGGTYLDHGRAERATIAFRDALAITDLAGACRAAVGLVDAAVLAGGDHGAVLAALDELARRPRPGDCAALAEERADQIATGWHLEQRRLRSDPRDVIAAYQRLATLATTEDGRRRARAGLAQLATP